jgi:alkylation response protein AidB-like acyl-CoA dehydrogenase
MTARVDTARSLADEVQAWVEENWDERMTVREWWRRLADTGYAYPTWPEGVGGGGMSGGDARTVLTVLARNNVVAPAVGGVASTLAAPTILDLGTAAQVAELVGPIATGEAAWCQLFSEPSSGSDLASLGARAVRDGDEWVVTGQKVWNSSADIADFGMLLARTDPDQPKHRGITYFALDMHQPGIEARPLKQMNGDASFCEVFLDGARVPSSRIIGELNDGWRTAQTTLFHERGSVAAGSLPGLFPAKSGPLGGDLDRPVGEIIERAQRAAKESKSAIRTAAIPAKVMFQMARDHGVHDDPVMRQALARYVAQVRVNGWTTRRIAAARGKLTGADGSMAKLATSRICQQSMDLSYKIVGAEAMLAGAESPMGGDLQRVNLGAPGTRLGGGTDEIQLNVLGERALDLPREPSTDKDVPYRDLEVGTRRLT